MLSLYSSTVKNVSKNVEMSFVEKEKFLVYVAFIKDLGYLGICLHSDDQWMFYRLSITGVYTTEF